jgi:uncharacterized protein (DUF1778 family)
MSALKQTKNERIDIRVSLEDKVKIQDAASFLGISQAEFMLKSCLVEAERALQMEEQLELDSISWKNFCQLLESPKTPSKKLKSSMAEYIKNQKD